MRLNGQQIYDKDLVTKIADPEQQVQQVGIDLQVIRIHKTNGCIILKNKTIVHPYRELEPKTYFVNEKGHIASHPIPDGQEVQGWLLDKGSYSVTFEQGVTIPEDHSALIVHRTSLMRGGNALQSGMWDPGFSCENMGSMMVINEPTFIEVGARIGQIYFDANEACPEERLYRGQWQGH